MPITKSYSSTEDRHPHSLSSGSPDALELLRREHEAMESLFAQYEADKDVARHDSQLLLARMYKAVHEHGHLEAELVYPFARTMIYDRNDLLLLEFEDTHADLTELISQLQGLSYTNAALPFLVEELIESVRLHIEEEQATLFNDLRGLPGSQLEQLRQDLQQRLNQRSHLKEEH